MIGERPTLAENSVETFPSVLGSADVAAAFLEEPNGPLWYVAYGSNLSSSVFKGRRGIKPIDERHVLVEGLELTFDLPGLPYVEPRFANCRFASGSFVSGMGVNGNGNEKIIRKRMADFDLNAPWTGKGALIGVAYLVSPSDFARVINTEGGGSGYRMVSVEGKVFKAKKTPGEKEERFYLTGEIIHGFTLLAPEGKTRRRPGCPSARYLSLIRNGAEEHNLPSSYRAYLSSLKPYTAVTFRQKLGAAISIALMALPMIVIMLLGFTFARKDGTYPRWTKKARDGLLTWVWPTYDNCLRRWFGEGE